MIKLKKKTKLYCMIHKRDKRFKDCVPAPEDGVVSVGGQVVVCGVEESSTDVAEETSTDVGGSFRKFTIVLLNASVPLKRILQ